MMNKEKFENSSQLEQMYGVAADTSVSMIIEGDHGIGKSESVYSFAKKNNMNVEPLFLSHQEVADLIGIPTLEKNEKGEPITTWSKPIWLERMEEAARAGKRNVLFLDELNRAQSEVRQAALQLVLDKQIHEHRLPKTIIDGVEYDTFVVAAINPADGFYQVDELDPALMDRFLHFKLEVNANTWLDWASENNIHKTIIAFIANSKDKLYVKDPNATMFPTPRSWTKLSELLYSYESKGVENHALLHNLITGKIGYTVGAQFMSFYKERANMVSVEEIENITKTEKKKLASKAKDELELTDGIAKKIKKVIEDVEIPVLKDLTKNLVEKYLPEDKDTTFEEALPLLAYLHALPVEQLAATIKDIQLKSEENGTNTYDNLAMIAPKKMIFRRIVNKVKKYSIAD